MHLHCPTFKVKLLLKLLFKLLLKLLLKFYGLLELLFLSVLYLSVNTHIPRGICRISINVGIVPRGHAYVFCHCTNIVTYHNSLCPSPQTYSLCPSLKDHAPHRHQALQVNDCTAWPLRSILTSTCAPSARRALSTRSRSDKIYASAQEAIHDLKDQSTM
jgi:hypothetical protein